LLLLLPFPFFKKIGIISLFSLLLNTGVVFIIKFTVKRQRKKADYHFIEKVDPYSFPSGHVSRLSGFIFTTLDIPIFTILFIIFSITTSITRMIKGYHYFSDCYFAFLIGLSCGLLSLLTSPYYMKILYNFNIL
jgi:membrane-associated phospholipid phosphatase